MASAEDFTRFPLQMWEKVLSKVKKAVVFMDDECTEALHWCGGAALLLEAGARNLKQFSSFEACGVSEPKAVFVVSSLLKGRTVDIIKDIISLSHFQYCVVITSVAHSVHLLANSVSTELEGSPVFEQFEEKLCEWMGNMNYTAEVMHVPVVFTPVCQQLLLTPMFSHLFPLLSPDLEAINAKRPEKKRFGSLADLDMHSLPVELQLEIRSLAAALNSVFEATGTREESFAVGPMSRMIAGELANQPQAKNRRKTAPNKASIIFVDRTMDLTGAVGHHGDNLVEKILTVLKPLPGHITDVQVDMLDLTGLQRTPHTQNTVAPGCLAQTQSSAAQTLWEAMLTNKHKEGVMEVRRQLVEAASKEKLPIKMSMGRVTPEQLCSYVQLFRNNWGALESHCGVLQLGLATAQTLRHPYLPRWDACLAFERLLLQALGDSEFPTVLRQLLPLVKPRGGEGSSGSRSGEDECGPDELILLLIYLYSLADEAQPADGDADDEEEEELEKLERELIGAFTLVLTTESKLSPLLQKLTGCVNSTELTTERAHSAVEEMFETLRGLSHTRDHLKQLRSVYTASDGIHQATYRPFLRQILEEVFHPDRPECPDIEHMSGGLTDLLKTGFSMFMKVSRPHPSDNPLLFLFLVGGVTPSELRLIKEVVSAHKPGTQVLVLSTRLLRPTDIPELLFTTQRLLPDIGV
ncbi:sec1 family domain-containing protein 2 [Notolabrus celidotus]|uniref:sec1 family domain-containing protein 2 n=1 Tax=Notolabrus celidotus TaxID=1203425 RepID=UPI00148F9488|nr:sec1 family domain-containing protein 2 [Notolabrus celidotus]XP_034562519.1 sec1 family domain-containing protein 2 [Notolabrus celidotus]XP_034562528.1 sec1 family domain-containing protein 2 [Notolabrus celidotus]